MNPSENSKWNNFAAYAIVLQKQATEPLKDTLESMLKRFQTQMNNVEFIQLKNDEVILI